MDVRALSEAELAVAIKRYPLPEELSDGQFSLADCAQALGVSLPTMQGYLRRGMPAVERGGLGKAWRIRLSEAWAWRGHFIGTEREKQQRAERISGIAAALRPGSCTPPGEAAMKTVLLIPKG